MGVSRSVLAPERLGFCRANSLAGNQYRTASARYCAATGLHQTWRDLSDGSTEDQLCVEEIELHGKITSFSKLANHWFWRNGQASEFETILCRFSILFACTKPERIESVIYEMMHGLVLPAGRDSQEIIQLVWTVPEAKFVDPVVQIVD